MKRRLLIAAALLLALVGAPAAVWLREARAGGPGGPVREATQTALSPVMRILAWAPQKLADGLEFIVVCAKVRRRNEALERKLRRLEAENTILREELAVHERVGKAMGLTAKTQWPMSVGRVLARDGKRWARSLVIDRGAARGVAPGDPVLHQGGLAGAVLAAGPWTSTVQLLCAPQAAVGVIVLPGRARGVVSGTGDDDRLRLILEDPNVPLEAGQRLITSGLENSLYPGGLTVGVISLLKKNRFGQTIAEVKPAVDFRRIEELFVIQGRRRPPSPGPAVPAPPPPKPDRAP